MGTKARGRRPDYVMLAATLALLVIGIIMVFSSSYATAGATTGDPFFFIKRQIIWAVVGLFALTATMRMDYRVWRRLAIPGYLVCVGLLGLVLLVGNEVSGARRWIDLGFVRLQPSELAKLAVINLLAAYAATFRSEIKKFWKGMALPLGAAVLAFGLIMLEPDFGTGFALMLASVSVLYLAGVRPLYLVAACISAVPAAWLLVVTEPYRVRRIMTFLDPWSDPRDSGWNIIQSLLAIGSGGLFGLGLGESRQKFSYLPEQHTDFIFAILAEELGLLGSATVLLLFLALAWRGCRAALQAPDLYGCILAAGLTTMIVLQAFINVGVVSGSLPATGITLPLISSGGSSLVVTLAAIGILLNISAAGKAAV